MPEQVEVVVLTPADVSAFVDGELSPEESRDVAACAGDDDRVACLIGAWRWQLELLHAAFVRTVEEPIPERPGRWIWIGSIALMALLILALGLRW